MKKIYTLVIAALLNTLLFGANQTVINTNDTGVGSLRGAIAATNSGDTVFFASNLAGATITLASQIGINADLFIQGFSTGNTIAISGGNTTRIFNISGVLTGVILNRIEIIEGSSSSGGAILNNGNLELNYCRLYNNNSIVTNSLYHGGGAIYNNTGTTLTVNHCEFFNNTVDVASNQDDARGGAIFSKGINLTINFTSFYNNSANNFGSAPFTNYARGGALFLSGGTNQVNSCTFGNNTAMSGNGTSISSGGAVYNSGTLAISNSTFSENIIISTVPGFGGDAIINMGTMSLYNTIIATVALSVTNDMYTAVSGISTSLGNNIIMDTVLSNLTFITGDILATPLLDTLAYNNNAFTKTAALLCGSPALNTGNNTNAPTLDQANQTRIFGSAIDIGAYEAQIAMSLVVTASSTNTSICQGDTITLIGGGANSYSWDNGVIDGVAFVPAATTIYTLIGTNQVCSDTTSITITVNSIPAIPIISLSGSDLTTGTYSTYQWYINGNTLTGETFQTITPTQNGIYTVEVSNGSCFNTSGGYNHIIVGLEDLSDSEMQIYPNPAITNLYIKNRNFNSVTIFNSAGEKIKSSKLAKGGNQLSVSELPQGQYFMQFIDGNKATFNTSFIKK